MLGQVTIKCKAPDGKLPQIIRDAEVLVDGEPLGRVTAVDIRLDWNKRGYPVARLEVIPDWIELEVDADGIRLSCRYEGQEYVLVPQDHWEQIQGRLDELREGRMTKPKHSNNRNRFWRLTHERWDPDKQFNVLLECIVRAESSDEARAIVAKNAGHEGAAFWLNETTSRCSELPLDGPPELLMHEGPTVDWGGREK